MAAEAGGQPDAGAKLAELRHAVHGVAERAGPGVIDRDFAELRIGFFDVGLQRAHVAARIARPCGRAARQHQAVAADDAVMIVGEVGVADAAAIADHLAELLAERCGGDHIGGDRQQRRADLRHQPADLHIAGEHHVVGAQPRSRRDDAFSHPRRIDRQRRRALENARAVAFRRRRQRQRVIERMDGDRLEIIDGVIVALAVQHRAHALGRPAFDLAAQIVEEPHQAQKLVAVVDLGHVEPAGLRIDADGILVLDGVADVIEAGLR